MSETNETSDASPSVQSQDGSSGQIFADQTGKEVFDAFERLGNEINHLTENIERQFEDADEEDPLGSFDFKGFVAASIQGISNVITAGLGGTESTASPEDPEVDDIIAFLNAEQQNDGQIEVVDESESSGSPQSKGHVKRDSTGASSIDADSIASGGSHLPKKISALINSMRNRSLSVDEASVGGGASTVATHPAAEEWENDDDCGYTVITLTEEEFFDYEEETSARILAERKEHTLKALPPASSPLKLLTYAAAAGTKVDKDEGRVEKAKGLDAESSVYEPYGSDGEDIVVDLSQQSTTAPASAEKAAAPADAGTKDDAVSAPAKVEGDSVDASTDEGAVRATEKADAPANKEANGTTGTTLKASEGGMEQLAAMLAQGGFGQVDFPPLPPSVAEEKEAASNAPEEARSNGHRATAPAKESRRQTISEQRRSEIMGQRKFQGVDGTHCYFNLKVIFEPFKTGFEESKDLQHSKGTILAGRYEVHDVLGTAAFSTALQCADLAAEEEEPQWVCLKVIKNNKDFFDQSLDEIKLLQYINSCGDPDEHHVLRLIDFFYCKEHLFIVSELLKENLYEFGRFIRESNNEPYYTMPRLKRIMKQVLEALVFIHGLKLIHCDIKPENIVIKSFSRCEVKLIDFGSSCFTSDHLTTYIQSRSYRAPEVIIGHPYDTRIDIWSVGAVLAELHTGYVLFQNDSVPTMLSRITGVLGQFPQHVLQRGKDTGKYFSLSNIVYERDEHGHFHLIFPKRTDLASRLHLPGGDLSPDEEHFVDFVRQMLHLDPNLRLTAEEALAHPWLADADTVHIDEYIIQQAQPPQDHDLDQDDYSYEEDGSEPATGDEASGSEADGEGEGDYEYEDYDLEAAEEEERALQYLLNAHGGSAEAMAAYLNKLQLAQQAQGEEGEEAGSGDEGEFDDSGDEHYEDGEDGDEAGDREDTDDVGEEEDAGATGEAGETGAEGSQ